MKLLRPWMVGRRAKRIYKVLLVLFVLFNILIFLVFPPVARHVAGKKASEALSRNVTIERIFLNPYALSLTVRGIRVSDRPFDSAQGGPEQGRTGRDAAGEFLSVGSVYVRAKAASIWKLAPVIGSLYVDEPMVRIVREDATHFNFSDLMAPKKEEQPPKPEGKPFHFSFHDIQLHGGRVLFEDKVTGRSHALEEIEVTAPSVSNFPYYVETDIQPAFSARLDGSPMRLEGTTRPFAESLRTEMAFKLDDLDLPRYVLDAPMPLNFRVPSGKLSLALTLSYVQSKSAAPSLSVGADVTLSDFVVTDTDDRPVLKLPEVKLTGLSARPLEGQTHLNELLIREPELNVSRSHDGQVNLLSLLPKSPPPAEGGSAEPAPALAAPEENAGAKPARPPMTIDVDRVALQAGKVIFTDEAAASAFKTTLSPINLEVLHFTNASGGKSGYSFDLRTESDETFSVKGDFSVAGKSLTAKLALGGLYLPKYAPYYSDALRATVSDGRLLIAGDAAASQENGNPGGGFTGRVALEKLAVLDQAGKDLIKWDALSFNGIKVAFPPASVGIEEILLDKLNVRVVMGKDGSLNLAQVAAKPAAAASPAPDAPSSPTPAQEATPPAVTIGKIALSDGRVEFQDRSIEPNFSTSLDAMNLSLTGFALDPKKQAEPGQFQFEAKLDNQAPISFSGRLQPARDSRLVDVTVALRDVQLSPLTPYTDKYIGYPLTKGKLVLDVKCLIQREKLGSNIKILLDQLTLGDRVDSPTATKLPIKFALALLRDRHGRITLDVPISGTLGDPKFRLWPVIVQTLVNLVEKAVTSPFAFLMGGKEEMKFVEFDYGSDALNAEAVQKLDEIAHLLADRPALRMDIQAETVSGPDEEALRKLFVERKVKTQKLKEVVNQVAGRVSLSDVRIAPGEYERYLRLAYEAEDIPEKPRGLLGIAKDVPREQMEKMLLQHTPVTADDLRRLAYQRAANVRDHLLAAQAADVSRLFMIEPERVATEGTSAPRPRVNFTLQLAEGGPAPTEKPFAPPPPAPREKSYIAHDPFSHFMDAPPRPDKTRPEAASEIPLRQKRKPAR